MDLSKMEEQFKLELTSDKKYQTYFSQFSSRSVDFFITEYARMKASLYYNKDTYLAELASDADSLALQAMSWLWIIQQKKLFDLQCKWRANEIELSEIGTSVDFEFWGCHIEKCPFLASIEEHEFEWLVTYTRKYKPENEGIFAFSLQDYYGKKEYLQTGILTTDGDPSGWYDYHNLLTGNQSLLLLPDVQGEREKIYWKHNFGLLGKKGEEPPVRKAVAPVIADDRPGLQCFEEKDLLGFMKSCEPALVEQMYLGREIWKRSREDRSFNNAVLVLRSAGEDYPMQNGKGWRHSIIKTAAHYERNQLADALEGAYAEYKFRNQTGISHKAHFFIMDAETMQKKKEWFDGLAREVKEMGY